MSKEQETSGTTIDDYVIRHLRFGWWCLLFFLTLGIVLEGFHGFKIDWYLNADNQTRQMMGRLAHAHGTLLGLVNIALALTMKSTDGRLLGAAKIASPCMISASLLMPLGFLLGGVIFYGGDPGLGILLVPPGGLLLLVSVLYVALALTWKSTAPNSGDQADSRDRPKRRRRP